MIERCLRQHQLFYTRLTFDRFHSLVGKDADRVSELITTPQLEQSDGESLAQN